MSHTNERFASQMQSGLEMLNQVPSERKESSGIFSMRTHVRVSSPAR